MKQSLSFFLQIKEDETQHMGAIKGPIMSKLNDLFTLMKCNKRTIFWLLMQSYNLGTWIALVVKEHLLDLEMLQASVSCVTLMHSAVDSSAPFFSSLDGAFSGMCFSLWQEVSAVCFSPIKSQRA